MNFAPDTNIPSDTIILEAVTEVALNKDLFTACPENEQLACHCYGLTESDVIKVVHDQALSSVGELTEHTGAGGACRACGDCLKRILAGQSAKKKSRFNIISGNPQAVARAVAHNPMGCIFPS